MFLINCLLIIDMQEGFVSKVSHELAGGIRNLLSHDNFDMVIMSKFVNKPDSQFVKELSWYGLMESIEQKLILPYDAARVFEKTSYSALNDNLKTHLVNNRITTVYLCGVDTDACILATTLSLFDLGIKVVVIENLCDSSGEKYYHESAIEILKRNIGKQNVINSESLNRNKKGGI